MKIRIVEEVLNWDAGDWCAGVFGMLLFALAVMSLVCLSNVIKADGRVDHCYIEFYNQSQVMPGTYVVNGHRPWRPDVVLGHADTPEQARDLLKNVCPAK